MICMYAIHFVRVLLKLKNKIDDVAWATRFDVILFVEEMLNHFLIRIAGIFRKRSKVNLPLTSTLRVREFSVHSLERFQRVSNKERRDIKTKSNQ